MLIFIRKVRDGYAILVQQLVTYLKKEGVTVKYDLSRALSTVYESNLAERKQHMFLKPGSGATVIPSGRMACKHPNIVYARCVVLNKSCLSEETCENLEQGKDCYNVLR